MHLFQVSSRCRAGCGPAIIRALTLACVLASGLTLQAQTESEWRALTEIRRARAAGELDRALRFANEVIKVAPNLAGAYLERAQVFDAQGDQAAARKDVEHAIELDPKSSAGRLVRAKLRLDAGEYEGVLEDLPPGQIGGETLLTMRGQALIALGRFQEALAIFTHLMSGPYGPNTNSRFPRALCLMGLGETAEAVDWFEADCGDGGLVESRHQLVLGYCLLGRYEQAKKHLAGWLETADGAEPTDDYDRYLWRALRENRPEAVYLTGVTQFAQGQFKETAATLDTIPPESSWSDDAQLLRHLARVRSASPGKTAINKESLKGAWAQTVGRFLRGELSERELLKLGAESPNAAERRRHQCQAAFYAGQQRLVAGDDLASTLLFEKAVATRAVESPEYTLAAIALKSTDGAPK